MDTETVVVEEYNCEADVLEDEYGEYGEYQLDSWPGGIFTVLESRSICHGA